MPTAAKRPTKAPATPWPAEPGKLHRKGRWLWLPLKKEWRNVTAKPEEIVRQQWVRLLNEEHGYDLKQMRQERRTQYGHRSPRADIVVWETPEKAASTEPVTPVLIVETKADAIEVDLQDYYQGESYTRAAGAEFFVAANTRRTAVFRLIPGAPGTFEQINAVPKAEDFALPKRLDALRGQLKKFSREEFQQILFECHSILRDAHKEPTDAFDAISKVLFIKMHVERTGKVGTFSTDYLDKVQALQVPGSEALHEQLFADTKKAYAADEIFAEGDKLGIGADTFRRLVKKLQRFDLSKTSDDVKGIAFERFLGTTFRGELGQFFTPRPVVDFMVDVLDPQEGELICDPAVGSGGFLIKAFEHVRTQIAADIRLQKDKAKAEIEGSDLTEDEADAQVEQRFAELNRELLPSDQANEPIDTRVGRLAWECIYGTDASGRLARTAKMNMIMHGDGHGGIHHHDGLVDVNGIFPGRFDVILSNPPFGSNVGPDAKVGATYETRVLDPDDPEQKKQIARYGKRFGSAWKEAHEVLLDARGDRVLDLFEIGEGKGGQKTEVLFVERCLDLLRPGGRLGIVLPDGNLNNPSLAWLRRWCEGRARIEAVVSLPEATFASSKANVKASMLFLRRFTAEDEAAWKQAWEKAYEDVTPSFDAKRDILCDEIGSRIVGADIPEVASLLDELDALGVTRQPPDWEPSPEPEHHEGVAYTPLTRPRWEGKAKNPKTAAALKRDYRDAIKEKSVAASIADADADMKARMKALDAEHNAALWAAVRHAFDYPVFVGAPRTVGISTTGQTGEHIPNELPDVLQAYREFRDWTDAGADPEDQPDFQLPSAA